MSTYNTTIGVDAIAAVDARPPGFLRRLFKSLLAVREAQARRIVTAHLAGMSDERLKDLGLAPDQVRRLRMDDSGGASWM